MAYSEKDIKRITKLVFAKMTEGMSLRKCLLEDGMPARNTFMSWIENDTELLNQYARACDDRAEHIADEILEIADDGTNDTITIVKGDVPMEVENREWTSRSKLRIEARQWLLGKMKPKKYGTTHQEVNVTMEQPLFPDVRPDTGDK